jgi:hypothetical protein
MTLASVPWTVGGSAATQVPEGRLIIAQHEVLGLRRAKIQSRRDG